MKIRLREHPMLQSIPSRSFATLMELYESNYILVRRLAPALREMADEQVSVVPGGVDLHLRVMDRAPYTTSVCLTHFFDANSPLRAQPDLRVRVYHDAHAAEVMPDSFSRESGISKAEWRADHKSLAWRWELNRFLNRWLRYCLTEGHSFCTEGPGPRVISGR